MDQPADIVNRCNRRCAAQLEPYAIPAYYKFRGAFPVHPNGKRDAEALRSERDGFLDPEGRAVDLSAAGPATP